MERNEDLTKVFDRRWIANHNNDVKKAREREKQFVDKMFNVKSGTNNSDVIRNTPGNIVNNLQKNIEGATNFRRQNNINNLKKKW